MSNSIAIIICGLLGVIIGIIAVGTPKIIQLLEEIRETLKK